MSNQKFSCLGCLGSLVIFIVIGSIFFGGGILMRLGNFYLMLGHPIERERVMSDYIDEIENHKDIVEKAVQEFHAQLDRGKCEEIYNRASELLRKSNSLNDVLKLCETTSRIFGSRKSTQVIDTWIQPPHPENYILTRYITQFSKGVVQEIFIWSVKNNKAEIVNYTFSQK
jgi:hypothetical protein